MYFQTIDPYPCYHNFQKKLKKLFYERLDTFIDKFQLLNNSQYGFRSQMSTSQCINGYSGGDYVIDICDKISIGVIIDLNKAFDTFNHNLLMDKLEYYGIHGIAQE